MRCSTSETGLSIANIDILNTYTEIDKYIKKFTRGPVKSNYFIELHLFIINRILNLKLTV